MIHELSKSYGNKSEVMNLTELDYWIFKGIEAQGSSVEKWLMDQK